MMKRSSIESLQFCWFIDGLSVDGCFWIGLLNWIVEFAPKGGGRWAHGNMRVCKWGEKKLISGQGWMTHDSGTLWLTFVPPKFKSNFPDDNKPPPQKKNIKPINKPVNMQTNKQASKQANQRNGDNLPCFSNVETELVELIWVLSRL